MAMLTADDGVKLYYEETGERHADRVRARVRRRPPQLGAAGAPLLAPLPLHRLQRARLSAFRRARGLRALLAGARARRHPLRARRARPAARARRRPVHGRIRHAAFRHGTLRPPRALSITRRRRRLRLAPGAVPAVPGRLEEQRRAHQARRHGGTSSTTYGTGRSACSSEIKDPRGFAEYLRQFKEHSALGAIEHAARRASAAGRRSTT